MLARIACPCQVRVAGTAGDYRRFTASRVSSPAIPSQAKMHTATRSTRGAVDQPKMTDGTWIRSWGVVVERSFAEAANLRLGQTITLNGRPFQVVGFAVTTAFGGFRLAEGTRRVGLLKAVGGTPGLVVATFLAENLFLALVAALVGLVAGWRAAPLISKPRPISSVLRERRRPRSSRS
jgi:hypothetical protein